MIKARFTLLIIATVVLSACAGPSVRYKKNVLSQMDSGDFVKAAETVQANKEKAYGAKNAVLYYLDLSTQQNSAYYSTDSINSLTAAQDNIEALYAKSVTSSLGTLLLNDNTIPYVPPVFEQALIHFYQAMDYIYSYNRNGALVEANRAVFMLDKHRENNPNQIYNDDAFVQYFASMIYEDNGKISDARIARKNAELAYARQSGSEASMPQIDLPRDYKEKGEAVIFHYNGKAPIKVSQGIMLAWDELGFAVENNGELQGTSQDIINAVYAGAFGNSITVSFPEFQDVSYYIRGSMVSADGGPLYPTQLVSDISWQAKQNLKQDLKAIYSRMVTRAVTKYILSVQARHIAEKNWGEDMGTLTGILFSVLSNVTERADTRSWFTLPAEIRMASIFLPPGSHNIKMIFLDYNGRPIDEYVFENVQIIKGKRTYLYYRTSR